MNQEIASDELVRKDEKKEAKKQTDALILN